MARIFISYRREDSSTVANILYNRLSQSKEHSAFLDKKGIPVGFDFRAYITRQIEKYDIMLSLIGNQWLTLKDDKAQSRISNVNDPLRMEIAAGLQNQKMLIIPVLIDNARMPDEDDLPQEIRRFHFLNATNFHSDEIEKSLDTILQKIEESELLLANGGDDQQAVISRDLSAFSEVITVKDDTCVVSAIVNAMQANLLAEKKIAVALSIQDLDKKTRKLSRLKKGEGSWFESAIYCAEFYGVKVDKWLPAADSGQNIPAPETVRLRSYRTDSLQEMIEHLNANRPLLVGVKVYDEMWTNASTTKTGLISARLPKTNTTVGGHAVVVTKIDLKNDRIRFVNSWGKEWGDKGFGFFSRKSFDALVHDNQVWAVEGLYG